jgi:hypothetical protein
MIDLMKKRGGSIGSGVTSMYKRYHQILLEGLLKQDISVKGTIKEKGERSEERRCFQFDSTSQFTGSLMLAQIRNQFSCRTPLYAGSSFGIERSNHEAAGIFRSNTS